MNHLGHLLFISGILCPAMTMAQVNRAVNEGRGSGDARRTWIAPESDPTLQVPYFETHTSHHLAERNDRIAMASMNALARSGNTRETEEAVMSFIKLSQKYPNAEEFQKGLLNDASGLNTLTAAMPSTIKKLVIDQIHDALTVPFRHQGGDGLGDPQMELNYSLSQISKDPKKYWAAVRTLKQLGYKNVVSLESYEGESGYLNSLSVSVLGKKVDSSARAQVVQTRVTPKEAEAKQRNLEAMIQRITDQRLKENAEKLEQARNNLINATKDKPGQPDFEKLRQIESDYREYNGVNRMFTTLISVGDDAAAQKFGQVTSSGLLIAESWDKLAAGATDMTEVLAMANTVTAVMTIVKVLSSSSNGGMAAMMRQQFNIIVAHLKHISKQIESLDAKMSEKFQEVVQKLEGLQNGQTFTAQQLESVRLDLALLHTGLHGLAADLRKDRTDEKIDACTKREKFVGPNPKPLDDTAYGACLSHFYRGATQRAYGTVTAAEANGDANAVVKRLFGMGDQGHALNYVAGAINRELDDPAVALPTMTPDPVYWNHMAGHYSTTALQNLGTHRADPGTTQEVIDTGKQYCEFNKRSLGSPQFHQAYLKNLTKEFQKLNALSRELYIGFLKQGLPATEMKPDGSPRHCAGVNDGVRFLPVDIRSFIPPEMVKAKALGFGQINACIDHPTSLRERNFVYHAKWNYSFTPSEGDKSPIAVGHHAASVPSGMHPYVPITTIAIDEQNARRFEPERRKISAYRTNVANVIHAKFTELLRGTTSIYSSQLDLTKPNAAAIIEKVRERFRADLKQSTPVYDRSKGEFKFPERPNLGALEKYNEYKNTMMKITKNLELMRALNKSTELDSPPNPKCEKALDKLTPLAMGADGFSTNEQLAEAVAKHLIPSTNGMSGGESACFKSYDSCAAIRPMLVKLELIKSSHQSRGSQGPEGRGRATR